MIAHIAMAAGFSLILIGLYGALTKLNLLRMIVAFSVANTGVNLVLISVGHIAGRTAPILDSAVPLAEAGARIIDPVPQALVLTAIVIGVGVTALMLAYAYKLNESRGTLDISKFRDLKW
ncbi:MAG: sodium:proton antiporter [Thiotrichales bacterium]